jgi:hypothetical protein
VTPAQAARLIGRDNTQCTYARGLPKPAAHRLDLRHSLVVIPHLCGNGAYNETSSVFVIDQAGRTRRAVPDTVVNGDWDARTRTLSSYAKGRGLGDCGVSQDYVWDGATLRLVRQAQLGECRGGRDYITTWRAAVVSR